MSAEAIVHAVMALEDPDVVERLSKGDRSALGNLELTGEEDALLDALIEEVVDAEVSGFGFQGSASLAAVTYVNSNLSDSKTRNVWEGYRAKYIKPGQTSVCACPGLCT